MKTINIEANPLVTQTITPIEFQMPANDSLADHELVQINFVNNEGKVFASAERHVIRFIDAENGEPAWFEAYVGKPTRPIG
jgi:hypothetical protein